MTGKILTSIAGFLMRHWKAVLAISILTAGTWWVYDLYTDNRYLTTELVLIERQNNALKAERDNLANHLIQIEEDMRKLEEKRSDLEDAVSDSERRINAIKSERDRALWELENEEIPDDCEEGVNWLVNRFQALTGDVNE